jgi:hypothetical protein
MGDFGIDGRIILKWILQINLVQSFELNTTGLR